MELESLFEMPLSEARFVDDMEALIRGQKPLVETEVLATSVVPVEGDDPDRSWIAGLLSKAYEAGMLVTQIPKSIPLPTGTVTMIRVLVCRREQAWRIPAFVAMADAFASAAWNDGAETLQSILLGYSEEDIASWLENRHHEQTKWGCPTLYGLLDNEQISRLSVLGMRSVYPDLLRTGIWFDVRGGRVLRKDALALCEHKTICRVAVDGRYLLRKLGDVAARRTEVFARVELSASDAAEFNGALRSKIECWTSTGWT